MTEQVKETTEFGTVLWIRYTRRELKSSWAASGQGHRQAVQRGEYCIVVPCEDEELALRLHAKALRCFAIPTCGHWDGQTFSFYCGDAGAGGVTRLMASVHSAFMEEIAEGPEANPAKYGKLFAE